MGPSGLGNPHRYFHVNARMTMVDNFFNSIRLFLSCINNIKMNTWRTYRIKEFFECTRFRFRFYGLKCIEYSTRELFTNQWKNSIIFWISFRIFKEFILGVTRPETIVTLFDISFAQNCFIRSLMIILNKHQ